MVHMGPASWNSDDNPRRGNELTSRIGPNRVSQGSISTSANLKQQPLLKTIPDEVASKPIVPTNMLENLPTEIVCSVVELCSPKERALLARACRCLREIAIPTLYKNDVRYHGASCVHYAITRCIDEETVIATLQKARWVGCDFQSCQNSWNQGFHTYAPLYLAARRGLHIVTKFLLASGAPPDGTPVCEMTPLFGALFAGQERTSLLLIQHTASLQQKGLSMNALHAAICAGLPHVAEYLLRERGMDVNERTSCGATPMMLAISSGNMSMIRLLTNHGACLRELVAYNHREPRLSATRQLLYDADIP